jgi:hypothetical protein
MPVQEKQPSNGPRRQIGYFCHMRIGEKHLGGILVTNHIGVPLEFKYTEPVTASELHKILYGSVLDRYLHETVIRDRLAREVRTEPEYFIAPYEEREFLSQVAGKEMMAVQRFKAAAGEVSGPFVRIRDREAIVALEEGEVMRLAFSTADEAQQHGMATWLQEIGRTMDVLEPLDRVAAALRSLCGEEKRA